MARQKYVPTHRDAPPKRVRTATHNVATLTGVAACATGVSVVGGVVAQGEDVAPASFDGVDLQAGVARFSSVELEGRAQQSVSRSSDRRAALPAAQKPGLSDAGGKAVSGSQDLTVADPRTLARALMPQYGLSSGEFDCLDNIWSQESGWNVHADNPSSSAYGIPQALPGSKMSSAGADWEHSAETQIRWGLGYIKGRYGSACSAWAFKKRVGWY